MDNNSDLNAQQYQVVLKYIQTTGEQNFQVAVDKLKIHGFNLQGAINSKFQMTNQENHGRQDYLQQQNHQQTNLGRNNNARAQQQIQRYLNYLRQKQNQSTIKGIFNFTKNFIVGLFRGITQLILPQFILQKLMRSVFYKQYQPLIMIQFRDRNLNYHLKNSYLSRKPIMFIISVPGVTHECFIKLFNRPQIAKKISQSYIFAGAISTDKQCEQIQGEKQPPCIIICRKNIYEKFQIVKRFVGQTTIESIDVDKLNYALRDHQRANRRDKNTLVKYRNYIRRHYYGGRPGFYQQQEQQQQLFQEKHTVVSDMIKKQNQEYKKVEQQTRRKQSIELLEKQKMQEQRKKHEQLIQQRKIRKMSIPDEPQQGEILRISFRCPDGNTKVRNFDSFQKLDLIYHWVETNEEIEFEDNEKRNFELLHGFPPASLSHRREEKLKDVFESDQQKIMIRQL